MNAEIATYPSETFTSMWEGAMTADEIRAADRQFAEDMKKTFGEVMDACYRRIITRDELRKMRDNVKIT